MECFNDELTTQKLTVGDIVTNDTLNITRTSSPSTAEELVRFKVSDADGYLSVTNITSTNGVFLPTLFGNQPTSNTWSLFNIANTTNDTGTTPLMGWSARLNNNSVVVNRPLFRWRNFNTNLMSLNANGNLGIGTISPTEKLEVNGSLRVSGTSSVFKPPKLTTAQRDALTPESGDMIYNTTTNKHQGYNGTIWNDLY